MKYYMVLFAIPTKHFEQFRSIYLTVLVSVKYIDKEGVIWPDLATITARHVSEFARIYPQI